MSRASDAVNPVPSSNSQAPVGSLLGGKIKSRGGSKSSDKNATPSNGGRKLPQQHSVSSGDNPLAFPLLGFVEGGGTGNSLPPATRTRLADLFSQIIQEFEVLHAENEALHQQLGAQSDRLQGVADSTTTGRLPSLTTSSPPTSASPYSTEAPSAVLPTAPSSATKLPTIVAPIPTSSGGGPSSSGKTNRPIQISQKIKTTYKASQSKILSSFKGGITNPMSAGGNNQMRMFKGHRDGVWDLALSKQTPIVLGTASADFTARIWCLQNEACLLQYVGHSGSVNSIRFHPVQDLVLTASGDGTAHIWRAAVSLPSNLEMLAKCQSSGEEELDGSEDDNLYDKESFNDSVPTSAAPSANSVAAGANADPISASQTNHSATPPNSATVLSNSSNNYQLTSVAVSLSQTSVPGGTSLSHAPSDNAFPVVRHPVTVISGHTDVVSAADWIHGGSQLVTASWDRTANLYDAESQSLIQSLTGHDLELTNVTCHPDQRLIVTSSKDTTFRLWDFRSLHSVNIFQGHSQPVATAVFAGSDKVVSGSDDRTVRVWDLKNMRSPLSSIRTDSAVNRLAVSKKNWIAIPCDNRHVKLYHLNGERLGRLRRSNRQGHRRMVTSTVWAEGGANVGCNLVTSGFDRKVLGWSVTETSNKD